MERVMYQPVEQPTVYQAKPKSNLRAAIVIVILSLVVGFIAWSVTGGSVRVTAGTPVAAASAVQEPVVQPEPSPPEPAPAAPQVVWVPVDAPTSLVIRRGAEVVLQANTIEEMEASGHIVPPGNGNPAWLNNVGTGFGTDMGTAWAMGHNIVGREGDPFADLDKVRPGDVIEIATRSGTVFMRVNDGMGDQPGIGVQTVPKFNEKGEANQVLDFTLNDPGVAQFGACSDDGVFNIIVTATLIK